jgi:hypothetical protein
MTHRSSRRARYLHHSSCADGRHNGMRSAVQGVDLAIRATAAQIAAGPSPPDLFRLQRKHLRSAPASRRSDRMGEGRIPIAVKDRPQSVD